MKIKYLLLLGLASLSLLACKKTKHSVRVVTNDTLQLDPINASNALPFDSLKLSDKLEDLRKFYRYNSYQTVWVSDKNRSEFLEAIADIAADGLNPQDYQLSDLHKQNQSYAQLSEEAKVQFDINLSERFFALADHLYNGTVDPKKLYNDWEIDKKQINLGATMHLALDNDAIAESLDSLRPSHPIYKELKTALADLRKLPTADFDEFGTGRKIKLNDSLPEIAELKKRLIYWGDLEADQQSMRFDAAAVAGLKHFQSRNGLDETGLLDQESIEALNISKSQREQQLIVNLERWRWYPRDLGKDYVLINIPNYSLVAVSQGDTIQSHKVIVGKAARKTPILSSKFSGLVINPTWTVPPTILKNDLTPAATKNRGYFASRGFTIYDSSGQEVSPQDWNPERASSYRYVQKPGKSNSLGRIKFDFKNSHMVYLHDTNNANNFNKDDRDLSSGCIRVQDPFDLADYILKTEKQDKYSKAKVAELLKSEKTNHIPLQKTVQVHQFYWTAWGSSKGTQYRTDIYHLDQALFEKLSQKSGS